VPATERVKLLLYWKSGDESFIRLGVGFFEKIFL